MVRTCHVPTHVSATKQNHILRAKWPRTYSGLFRPRRPHRQCRRNPGFRFPQESNVWSHRLHHAGHDQHKFCTCAELLAVVSKMLKEHATMCLIKTSTTPSSSPPTPTSPDGIRWWRSWWSLTKWYQHTATQCPTRSSKTIHSSEVYILQTMPQKFSSVGLCNVRRSKHWEMIHTPWRSSSNMQSNSSSDVGYTSTTLRSGIARFLPRRYGSI